jgi:predicted transcriptional regulator
MQRVPFKEIYCQDCKIILARYNEDYFSEASIDELSKLHYYYHIREGHSIIVRKKTDNSKFLSGLLMSYF